MVTVTGQLNGVDGAVNAGRPRSNLVRRGLAEAEDVVPGEDLAAVADRGEGPHRVHGPAAGHKLPDLLDCPCLVECRGAGGGGGGYRAALRGRHSGYQARAADRERA